MVEKRWLTVFIVTCALGLAVGLHIFELNEHSVCLYSLPTEPWPDGLPSEDFTLVVWHSQVLQNIHWFIMFHISHWGDWSFVCVVKSTKATRGDGTGNQQPSISKTVFLNHTSWDIGLLDAQQW